MGPLGDAALPAAVSKKAVRAAGAPLSCRACLQPIASARPSRASPSSPSTAPQDAPAERPTPADVPVHPRRAPGRLPGAAVDDAPVRRLLVGRGDQPAASGCCSTAARPGLSVAFDLPTQLGLDSDDPLARGEVGRTGVAIDSIADMRALLGGIPLDTVSTSMTINAPAALLLLLYELVAEEQGVAAERARRDDPERRAQGVHRPRQLHLPGPAEHAPDGGHVPVLHRAAAALQHDLDLGLPHPRGRARRPRRRSRSRSPTASPTCRRRSTPGSRWTRSRAGSRSSSTPTTTSSRRWRSSGRRGRCGPR